MALAVIGVAAPAVVFLYLLADPSANVSLNDAVDHLVITTNVAVLAFFAGVLVARAALQLRQYRTLLVALGFGSIGGIFAVHGLATPGVLLRGDPDDALAVVALSAELALLVPAVLFAVRYTSAVEWFERLVPARALVALVVGGVLVYAAVALARPAAIGTVMRAVLPSTTGGYGGYAGYATNNGLGTADIVILLPGVVAIALFLFSAIRQGQEFLWRKLPLQGALVASYVLLAQTQISMTLGQLWSLAWWEYHGLMLAAIAIALVALFVELDRRRGLERFLPRTVVERVLQGDELRLEGDRRVVTVVFTDLRGSTALADTLDPETVVGIVNTYLRTMARAVVDRGGIIDKFTGDGLMAIFGVMSDAPTGARAAAGAALDMRASIGALNTQRAASGAPVLKHGVGLHVGEVVLGAIGLPERSEYTAMGDTVNTASRMESLCKEFGVDSVLSADIAASLDGTVALRPLGEATVKGKAQPITVLTLA
ncbi:MAG: adenylate/guanylate cyclase domain-containing protein [Chloroflexota bacterium]|nr:adenylate/guanylate cyclase domain-containing protein [Chloroflexota bacterium]